MNGEKEGGEGEKERVRDRGRGERRKGRKTEEKREASENDVRRKENNRPTKYDCLPYTRWATIMTAYVLPTYVSYYIVGKKLLDHVPLNGISLSHTHVFS